MADAVEFYLSEVDAAVAARFVDELERAVRRVELHAEIGSLRFAFELDVPGLRSFRVDSFPYLILNVIREDHLDVLRVLHTSRDVPALLGEA